MSTSLRDNHDKAIHEVERYRRLIECIQGYAILLLDASGYIETWNVGVQKIYGYNADEVIGKHFSIFYTADDCARGKPDNRLLRAAQDGRMEDEDWRIRKDGTHFWAEVTLTALHNDNGTLVGFATVARDNTERKKAQSELVIANNLFKQQHLTLETLNNIKDEFISLASHQLRTPATGIKQFLGILLEGYAGDLTTTQLRYIQKAYDSNERQIQLINSLLRTAQIDAGKTILNKSYVNLKALVKDVIGELKDVFASRKQTIRIERGKEVPAVYIDESRMRMVLENLIDNASKYT
ncbi:MAG TPA: PAS domain-containing sensor histidine kinase, partial [Candidatus Saccharimonadales bacterium]|nr:PAS domain-containing sensor histidine kinase [Candidatus Saccharimonadales bacterium]